MNKKNNSVRYIVIGSDGNTVPDVEKQNIVLIHIRNNTLHVGLFSRISYLNNPLDFLQTPKNIATLEQEIQCYVQQHQLNTSTATNAVLIACPSHISCKMIW